MGGFEARQHDLEDLQIKVYFISKPEPEANHAWLPNSICRTKHANKISFKVMLSAVFFRTLELRCILPTGGLNALSCDDDVTRLFEMQSGTPVTYNAQKNSAKAPKTKCIGTHM
jgi:hypothetical protein